MKRTNSITGVAATLFRSGYLLFALIPITTGSETLNNIAWGAVSFAFTVAIIATVIQLIRHKMEFIKAALQTEKQTIDYKDFIDLSITIVGVVIAHAFSSPLLSLWIAFAVLEVLGMLIVNVKFRNTDI